MHQFKPNVSSIDFTNINNNAAYYVICFESQTLRFTSFKIMEESYRNTPLQKVDIYNKFQIYGETIVFQLSENSMEKLDDKTNKKLPCN